jgi:glyoxylase-like metal-dependent hydrolase (beta-lactamase superfamily II)
MTCPFETVTVTAEPGWHVESLGRGAYLFRWQKGFYLSPFVVDATGVWASDPISAQAAQAYRAAIESVTDAPIRWLGYSHDHRDHIVGGHALAPDADVLAHPHVARRVDERNDADIRRPTHALGDGHVHAFGSRRIDHHYFGPNHSGSNVLYTIATDHGRMLVWVDGVEPGVAPYRNLPDTDFAGYLRSLDRALELEFDFVIGGHTGPGGREWVSDYRDYLLRLLDATRREYEADGGQTPLPGEDGIAMTERVRRGVTERAAAAIRQRYGHWPGFDAWAPQTADRILSFLITGN